MTTQELQFVDEAVARHGRSADAVIPILQALQEHYHWLPPEALRRVAELTDITPAAIAGVSTFYTYFRHQPMGKHLVRVCKGTACHVRGADLVHDAIRHHLHLECNCDTTKDGKYTVETVACVGCCTLAPVVQIDSATYGHLVPGTVPGMVQDFHATHAGGNGQLKPAHAAALADDEVEGEIRIGLGSCCIAKGSQKVFDAVQGALRRTGARAAVKRVGCVGMCHQTPMVEVSVKGKASAFYAGVSAEQAAAIVRAHFQPHGLLRRARRALTATLDRFLTGEPPESADTYTLDMDCGDACAFLSRQRRIATEHFGVLDPLDLDQYLLHDGFVALRKVIETMTPEQLIDEVTRAGLRGRGGAGFTTGRKWALVRGQQDPVRYIICNGDEGDPGAFMDRSLMEGNPHRVLEGIMIAARAIGADEAYVYVRAEYPLAVQRIRKAVADAEEAGILGDDVFGSSHDMRCHVMEGAGAFVCGEETALMASIEGFRGMPRPKPPFPAQSGLWGKPTVINNVETLGAVPLIIAQGSHNYRAVGTAGSPGTKTFALTGHVANTGLIEVPFGTTLREIIFEIGGGVIDSQGNLMKDGFKAVQIGGPSGGCLVDEHLDLPLDFDSVKKMGAMVGSGGLVVMNRHTCMVRIAHFFMRFTQNESCGKCVPCREGTRQMLALLDDIVNGEATAQTLELLEQLAVAVQIGSLCGLGKTAPNPVLSTLRHFRSEYEAHIFQKRCPAGECKSLALPEILVDRCKGCGACLRKCPVNAITGERKAAHRIDPDRCIKCGTCAQVCRFDAILGV